MKPAPFAYARAGSLDEVFDVLDAQGDSVRLLAGGQSLIPALNLRLAQPALLLDITGLAALRGVVLRGDMLVLGALTRHAELATDPLVARHAPLLAEAAPHIAHAAIRNRGTLGGSLALADPAAELPACAVALDATLVLRGRGGERRVAAAAFFRGLYETALLHGELIVALEVPVGQRGCVLELARRQGDYAIVGLAATTAPRLVFFGVGATPVRVPSSEAAFAAGDVDAAVAAVRAALDPPDDLHGPAALRRHLAGVLLRRAAARL